MKIYVFVNKNRKRDNGDMPVYICIARPPQRLYIQTGLFTKSDIVDDVFQRSESNHRSKTMALNNYLEQIEKIAIENSLLPHNELRQLINEKVFCKRTMSTTLYDYIIEYSKQCTAERTKDLYMRTAQKVEQYDKTATLNISHKWLDGLYDCMKRAGLKDNSISIHMRNIRAVFNWARREELTNNYPFTKFKIINENTRKRNIDAETLRFILTNDDIGENDVKYRDLFALSFYLIGINPVDLLNAKHSQIVNGRLEYRRRKTGKLYSVKIEPEAQVLLNKYKGSQNLVSFAEGIDYRHFVVCCDRHLKHFCEDLTIYYARHTWATIASDLDVSMDVISAALGHSNGYGVTNIYVDFNQKKVDQANRRVIDYILGTGE